MFSNNTRLKSIRGEIVHIVNCRRIPLQAQIKFVAKSAALLIFFDLVFHKQIAKTMYRRKLLQKWANLQNLEQFVESTNKY